MRTAELMIRALEQEGVPAVFGVPGEENLDVVDALIDSRIRFIPTRHEAGAAFMANAYGRLTGKAGVALATLGPGATNLITGIADATMDMAPMVAITGQARVSRLQKPSHQYIDIPEVARPLTRFVARVMDPMVVPELVRRAFHFAERERPGASLLELPEDIAHRRLGDAEIPPLLKPSRHEIPGPTNRVLQQAATLINRARFPLILAGNGVLREQAGGELTRFVERNHIPVTTTFMGKGALSDDLPWALAPMASGKAQDTEDWTGKSVADLIIAIGFDMVELPPDAWQSQPPLPVIHIAAEPSEIDPAYQPVLEVVGHIGDSLRRLTDMVEPRPDDARSNQVRRWHEAVVERFQSYRDAVQFPLHPGRVLWEIRSALGADDIVVSDVGLHKMWISERYPTYRPNTALISNGYAAMGFGLPAGLAAKWLYPERRVAVVAGDGGFMMSVMELETACRLRLGVVVVVLVDGGYGLIAEKQQRAFGRTFGVTFGNPDFVRLAESFGLQAVLVEKADDLGNALRHAAWTGHRPTVIAVPVDYSVAL